MPGTCSEATTRSGRKSTTLGNVDSQVTADPRELLDARRVV